MNAIDLLIGRHVSVFMDNPDRLDDNVSGFVNAAGGTFIKIKRDNGQTVEVRFDYGKRKIAQIRDSAFGEMLYFSNGSAKGKFNLEALLREQEKYAEAEKRFKGRIIDIISKNGNNEFAHQAGELKKLNTTFIYLKDGNKTSEVPMFGDLESVYRIYIGDAVEYENPRVFEQRIGLSEREVYFLRAHGKFESKPVNQMIADSAQRIIFPGEGAQYFGLADGIVCSERTPHDKFSRDLLFDMFLWKFEGEPDMSEGILDFSAINNGRIGVVYLKLNTHCEDARRIAEERIVNVGGVRREFYERAVRV